MAVDWGPILPNIKHIPIFNEVHGKARLRLVLELDQFIWPPW